MSDGQQTHEESPRRRSPCNNKQLELPVYGGSVGPDVDRYPQALRDRPASSPTIRASPPPRAAKARSPTSTATKACCSIAAIRSTNWPSTRRFLEVCYLLANGELPNEAELKRFDNDITYHTMLHAQFDRFFEGFRRDAHPMAIMVGTVGALSAFYHDQHRHRRSEAAHRSRAIA